MESSSLAVIGIGLAFGVEILIRLSKRHLGLSKADTPILAGFLAFLFTLAFTIIWRMELSEFTLIFMSSLTPLGVYDIVQKTREKTADRKLPG